MLLLLFRWVMSGIKSEGYDVLFVIMVPSPLQGVVARTDDCMQECDSPRSLTNRCAKARQV